MNNIELKIEEFVLELRDKFKTKFYCNKIHENDYKLYHCNTGLVASDSLFDYFIDLLMEKEYTILQDIVFLSYSPIESMSFNSVINANSSTTADNMYTVTASSTKVEVLDTNNKVYNFPMGSKLGGENTEYYLDKFNKRVA